MDVACPKIIHNRYTIESVLGQGKFGLVFKARDEITEEPVAIKREISDVEFSSIKHETKIMTYLFQHRFRKLPFVYWYGAQQGFHYLVMTYYDCPLEQYMAQENARDIFPQCIQILQQIHKLFVLHRDIKPDNFMVDSRGEVHLIDYSLATFYLDGCGEHIADLPQPTITGTPKYVSLHNHHGHTITRRDDLISLGYMFMYFLYGYLPWQEGMGGCWEAKNWAQVAEFLENETPIGAAEPSLRMYRYLQYCYSLEFAETPNYSILCGLFE